MSRGAPLARQRDFLLLQLGQLLSDTGSRATAIAYPLLALAVTGSPAQVGLVASAGLVPPALLALFAGVAADRLPRKRLMIGTDVVRCLAVASLGAAILLDALTFAQIVVVAVVEGVGSTFFAPAAAAALRSVVARDRLPAAAGAQEARSAGVGVLGPPLGGALFSLGRAVPFVADAASYACSTASLLLMRTPFEEARERPARRDLRAELGAGLRFLWAEPFVRTCALIWAVGNLAGSGLFLLVVVLGRREGLSGGRVGLLLAAFAGALLVGALLSPLARRLLGSRAIILAELWAGSGCAAFLIWPRVEVLVAGMLPSALVIPVSDSVVDGYRLAVTPDALVGRVEGARRSISLWLAPLGPLLAGVLLDAWSPRAAVAVFTALGVALAVWATLSRPLRLAPERVLRE